MADALKAEGNKAFAEKKFEDAVYETHEPPYRARLTYQKIVINSPKQSR